MPNSSKHCAARNLQLQSKKTFLCFVYIAIVALVVVVFLPLSCHLNIECSLTYEYIVAKCLRMFAQVRESIYQLSIVIEGCWCCCCSFFFLHYDFCSGCRGISFVHLSIRWLSLLFVHRNVFV